MVEASAIRINGKEHAMPPGGRLADLLESLQLNPRQVIVELNGEALLRDEIPGASLKPGDKLEIVRPVAGG